MKHLLPLALASVMMSACEKKPPPPVAMRLRVEPGKVLWGEQSLPTHPDDLAEYLRHRIASGEIEPVVRVDFARNVIGERMGRIFNAVICGEDFVNTTLYFSIAGHRGRDFRLMLPTACCEPAPSEPFCDEWGEGMTVEFRGRRYMEFDVALRDGEFTGGGEPLEPEETVPMLAFRRRQADEITVHLSIGSEDTVGQLLPLLVGCQSLEMDIHIGAEQREADENEQRRLARLLINRVRLKRPWFCPPSSAPLLPDVPSRCNFTIPPLLPERWLMSAPMGIARSEGGGGGSAPPRMRVLRAL